ncbi:MAG: LCP family protein [Oscillospiraceae bacterium]|nr:LCP family protein [Oscillospiraceae bacterium]
MNKRERQEFSELEELLWRAEAVTQDPPEEPAPEEFDLDDFDFEETEDDPVLYRNYANGYGNAPAREPEPAYGDYADDDLESWPKEPEPERFVEPPRKKRKKRRRKHRFLTRLIAVVLILVVALSIYIQPPKSADSIGARKSDTATILLCGTDADGMRTDTMMLLYLSGSERRVGLLSLPRDSYTITASGKAAKLNSAYGRNGGGEEGMEVLLDYVKNIIGYRPDGYILVDFTLVPQIVDIMGGVDVEVPMDMEVDGVSLSAGYQHLSGQEVLTILRFRKGYATADLGRVEVQRTVLEACMSQWLSLGHITDAMEALSLLESGSTSSLTTRNYLWAAKALLLGMGSFESDTLPGTAEYRGDVSYYILDRSGIAELIDGSYNPYKVTITAGDLNIAN